MKIELCLLAILLISLFSQINPANAQIIHGGGEAQPVPCWVEVEQKSNEIITTENSSKAIALAGASKEFKENTVGFSVYLMFIMVGWSHDQNCNLTSEQGLAVFYELDNAKSFDHTLVLTVDPSLTKIIKVSTQRPNDNSSVLWVNDRNVKGNFPHSPLPEFPWASVVLASSISLLILTTMKTRLRF